MALSVPAGAGEKLQYLIHSFNDNTVRFAVYYPGRLRSEALLRAVRAVIDRSDVLRSSFHAGSATARWLVNEDYADADCFSPVKADGDVRETAELEMLRRVEHGGRTQLHCTLVEGGETSALVLTVSHLCADGSDAKYLLLKIAEAYRLIAESGSADGLAVKNGSRSYDQLFEGLSKKEYRSLCRLPRSGGKTAFPFPESTEPVAARAVTRVIPAETVKKARARAAGATVNDLLLAAYYLACARLPGSASGTVSVASMMDLRRHCAGGDSAGPCNLSGFLYTALPEEARRDFTTALSEIAAQTKKAKEEPLAGMMGVPLAKTAVSVLPLRLLTGMADRLYGDLSMGLTNLGSVDCRLLVMDGMTPTGGVFAGPVKKKPGMQVCAAGFDGAVTLCSVSECTKADAALLGALLDAMAEEIAAFAGGGE